MVIMFVQSMTTMVSQRRAVAHLSERYVRNLADYAADRYEDSSTESIRTFLSLLADPGYNAAVSTADDDGLSRRARQGMRRAMKEKFIPGFVAYIDGDGNLIAYSQNAAVLAGIFERAPLLSANGHLVRGGSVESDIVVGGKTLTYIAHIVPTVNPSVYAVAAVTLHTWVGRGGFGMMKLAVQGMLSMLAALVALFLLRRYLIGPLQDLSAQVNTLKWGSEMPPADAPRKFFGFRVEEIASLKSAIIDLARRIIEKEELEKRYMNDILKAQEDERKRIARDIHDGPIQVVAALIQRIQMASLAARVLDDETRAQLATVEGVAQDAVEELRGICDSLMPPWVSLGVASCVEEAANRFERLYNVKIDAQVDHMVDLDQERTLAVYRIFHEAVSNAVRHGRATEIEASVSRAPSPDDLGEPGREGARLVVRDNGAGFHVDPTVLPKLPLMGKRGLAGMRQRAELLGGTCDVQSEPDVGTTITVEL